MSRTMDLHHKNGIIIFYIFKQNKKGNNKKYLLDYFKEKKAINFGRTNNKSVYYFSKESSLENAQKALIKSLKKHKIEVFLEKKPLQSILEMPNLINSTEILDPFAGKTFSELDANTNFLKPTEISIETNTPQQFILTNNSLQARSFDALENNIGKIQMHKFYTPAGMRKLTDFKDNNFRPFGNTSDIKKHAPSFFLYSDFCKSQIVYYFNDFHNKNGIITFHLFNQNKKENNKRYLLDYFKENKVIYFGKKGYKSVYYFSKESSLENAQNALIKSLKKHKIEVFLEKKPLESILEISLPLNSIAEKEMNDPNTRKRKHEYLNNNNNNNNNNDENIGDSTVSDSDNNASETEDAFFSTEEDNSNNKDEN